MMTKIIRSRVVLLASALMAVAIISSYAMLASAQRSSRTTAPSTVGLSNLLGVEESAAVPSVSALSSGTPGVAASAASSRRRGVSGFYPIF